MYLSLLNHTIFISLHSGPNNVWNSFSLLCLYVNILPVYVSQPFFFYRWEMHLRRPPIRKANAFRMSGTVGLTGGTDPTH